MDEYQCCSTARSNSFSSSVPLYNFPHDGCCSFYNEQIRFLITTICHCTPFVGAASPSGYSSDCHHHHTFFHVDILLSARAWAGTTLSSLIIFPYHILLLQHGSRINTLRIFSCCRQSHCQRPQSTPLSPTLAFVFLQVGTRLSFTSSKTDCFLLASLP